jgi:hypothetical protein
VSRGTVIYLVRDGKKVATMREPFPGAPHAVVKDLPCPACADAPFKVAGSGMAPSEDDRAYEAEGYCCACKAHVGRIRAEVNTLFGVREDRAVLQGRCRVY